MHLIETTHSDGVEWMARVYAGVGCGGWGLGFQNGWIPSSTIFWIPSPKGMNLHPELRDQPIFCINWGELTKLLRADTAFRVKKSKSLTFSRKTPWSPQLHCGDRNPVLKAKVLYQLVQMVWRLLKLTLCMRLLEFFLLTELWMYGMVCQHMWWVLSQPIHSRII